jgi:hypothetical protein
MSIDAASDRPRGKQYEVRPYQPGDRAGVFALLERVWGPRVAGTLDALWAWRLTNPDFTSPEQAAGLVLVEDGAVNGVMTLSPVQLSVAGAPVLGTWGGDFVVHPRHRGRGLLVLRRVLSGDDAMLGTPNEPSRALAERLGMTGVCMLQNRVKPVRAGRAIAQRTGLRRLGAAADRVLDAARAVAARVRPLRTEPGVRVSPITEFDARFDDLWARAGARHGILAVRDARRLNWRFVEQPLRAYEIAAAERAGRLAGYVVFYATERHGLYYGHIVDFLVDGEDRGVRDALFAHATRSLVDRGVDLVNCYHSPDASFYREGLVRCGFWIGVPKQIVLVKNPGGDTFPAGLPWFFTRADSDLDLT